MISSWDSDWVETLSIGTWSVHRVRLHVIQGFFHRRDKLRANVLMKEYALEVNLTHLTIFNEEVASAVQEKPGDVMPLVR